MPTPFRVAAARLSIWRRWARRVPLAVAAVFGAVAAVATDRLIAGNPSRQSSDVSLIALGAAVAGLVLASTTRPWWAGRAEGAFAVLAAYLARHDTPIDTMLRTGEIGTALVAIDGLPTTTPIEAFEQARLLTSVDLWRSEATGVTGAVVRLDTTFAALAPDPNGNADLDRGVLHALLDHPQDGPWMAALADLRGHLTLVEDPAMAPRSWFQRLRPWLAGGLLVLGLGLWLTSRSAVSP